MRTIDQLHEIVTFNSATLADVLDYQRALEAQIEEVTQRLESGGVIVRIAVRDLRGLTEAALMMEARFAAMLAAEQLDGAVH